MSSVFTYNAKFQVLICERCETCVRPNRKGQTRHLYNHPHYVKGEELKKLLALFESYQLNPGNHQNVPRAPVPVIRGLKMHNAVKCGHCDSHPISVSARFVAKHVSKEHRVVPKDQVKGRDWRKVSAQTFFAETAHRQYFEVRNDLPPSVDVRMEGEFDEGRRAFFRRLADDELAFEAQTSTGSGVVGEFDAHKSEAIPWLDRTGIECHLRGLPKTQVLASYRLPQAGDQSPDLKLALIVEATGAVLASAHHAALPAADSKLS